MKAQKIDEIIKAAREYDYKLGEIYDQQGNKVTKSNAIHIKPYVWLEKTVKPYLKRKNAPSGIYQINLYADSNKRGTADVFYTAVGTPSEENQAAHTIVLSQPHKESENVLSWESALEMKTELERLRLENDNLKAKCAELEAELEAADENTGLSAESPKHWLADTLAGIVPVVQTFFEDRQKQRELEYAKLKMQMRSLNVQEENPEQIAKQRAAAFWQALAQENKQAAEAVETLATKCEGNEEAFLQTLQSEQPEIYNAFINYVNNAA